MINKQLNYRVDEKILNNFVKVCNDERKVVARVLEDLMEEYTKNNKKELGKMNNTKYEVTAKIGMEGFDGTITAVCEFDSEDDNYSELSYLHVMTSSNCESVRQVLSGWSEQDQSENEKWYELVRRIQKNNDLCEFMANDEPTTLEFNIHENGALESI